MNYNYVHIYRVQLGAIYLFGYNILIKQPFLQMQLFYFCQIFKFGNIF